MGSKKSICSTIALAGALALSATSALANGACCKPDGACFIYETQAICDGFGGVFHADLACYQVECVEPTTTTIKTTTTTLKTTTTTVKKPSGCTPGYWKQDHHFDSWVDYEPGDSFEAVFGRDVPGNPTLLDALWQGGGGLIALMRHSVAALLNASNPAVDPVAAFDTPAEVIDAFQSAYDTGNYSTTKNLLETSNETGCPLN